MTTPLHTLAFCLDAPMQSWGLHSRGNIRDTGREPSKSGVVGLLGAAIGVERHDTTGIAQLAGLRMGIRVDREGILERDYHTVQDVPTTTGGGHRTAVSHRYYLADALFLIVLESEDKVLLSRINEGLRKPAWPLFLGRRAFVPARALVGAGQPGEPRSGLGLSDRPLQSVLAEHPWLEDRAELLAVQLRLPEDTRDPLRTVVDCHPTDPAAEIRPDMPISFSQADRRFATRTVRTGHVPLTDSLIRTAEEIPCT
ncbi:type I-E CRISPR-associated protein Cas5/CasD [Allorhizocola rhizosphaerae]|uniref:type I-E CRISPR-associated protein Cas5/CasD n=1 Tax=Allorhizocola rhizosphaerae TaxID=1872709 RepID=UPI000E3D8566|nr:type I-E CRISPR-associated protein Cas5/CasD [Allorhizocola rhizosphaerae]